MSACTHMMVTTVQYVIFDEMASWTNSAVDRNHLHCATKHNDASIETMNNSLIAFTEDKPLRLMVCASISFRNVELHMNFSDCVNSSGYKTHTVEGLASRHDARYLFFLSANHKHPDARQLRHAVNHPQPSCFHDHPLFHCLHMVLSADDDTGDDLKFNWSIQHEIFDDVSSTTVFQRRTYLPGLTTRRAAVWTCAPADEPTVDGEGTCVAQKNITAATVINRRIITSHWRILNRVEEIVRWLFMVILFVNERSNWKMIHRYVNIRSKNVDPAIGINLSLGSSYLKHMTTACVPHRWDQRVDSDRHCLTIDEVSVVHSTIVS